MSSTQGSTPSYVYVSPSSSVSDDSESEQASLSIVYRNLEYATSIPRDKLLFLDHFRTAFLSSLGDNSREADILGKGNVPQSTASLALYFIQYLLKIKVEPSTIQALVQSFQRDFLILTDIHSVISSLPDSRDVKKHLLRTYYSAVRHCSLPARTQQSALFKQAEKGTISLVAIFGGQGASNPRCVEELRDLYETYSHLLKDLIARIDDVLHKLCRLNDTVDFYQGREISLKSWLDESDTVPDPDFLSTAAVSFPIIGAIGLAHYCVVCHILKKTPGEIRSLLNGITGHSQGIVVAAGISRSDSWASFYENAELVTTVLFWLGYESHRAAPKSILPATLIRDSIQNGDGHPSPMLHVGGIDRRQIQALLDKSNAGLPPGLKIHLALINSRDSFVIAGAARSLVCFSQVLRELSAEHGQDQTRIPFNRRKPTVNTQFLPISAPFHTPYLKSASERVNHRLSQSMFHPSELFIPVYHTRDGSDMRQGQASVLSSLIEAVATDPVDWPATLNAASSTHVLAFGKGVGELVEKNTDGRGVRVIFGTTLAPSQEGSGSMGDMFTPHLQASFLAPQSWEEQFRPRLSRSSAGAIRIENRLTSLLNTSPILVGGMTPTTVPWDFVSAIMKAGYYAELAGGGYYNAESMEEAIFKLSDSVPAGRGLNCNLIYASPHSIAWQITMLRRLAQKGRPVEGLTIGAGVPNLEVATEYIQTLGLKHITLKPGSENAIEKVLEIAKAHPKFPVIIQWTGGRGGGHHSFEDFHKPILSLYGKIRNHINVALVAGSGFGNAEDSYPYLTGSWSTRYGYPKMPFDGILLGSRMMVAKEAHTSQAAKQMICNAPGASDHDWTLSYTRPVGGVVTVQSEMGQPIHKLANRAVLFWKEMDDHIFSLPRAKQLEAIHKQKNHIIRRLNADFSKPWFGRNKDGQVVDLSEMTYLEILDRLISLMYVPHQKRWIDPTYSALVHDFVIRTTERMPADLNVTLPSISDPIQLRASVLSNSPDIELTVIHPEDTAWFVTRCKARGQKPVNFIPILDEDFSYWLKKDSLWQSEDIDAVVDQDPERVCILHGPVAAKYSHRVDETAKDILDGINNSLVAMLQSEFYLDQNIEYENNLKSTDQEWSVQAGVHIPEGNGGKTFQVIPGKTLPSQGDWLRYLTNQTHGWIRSIFASEEILKDNTRQPNYLRQFFEVGWTKSIHMNKDRSTVTVRKETEGKLQTILEMSSADGSSIRVNISEYVPQRPSPVVLTLQFKYDAASTSCCLRELVAGRNRRVQSFYSRLWLDSDPDPKYNIHSTFPGIHTVLTHSMLREWEDSVSLSYSNDGIIPSNTDVFPLNACIVPAWEALVVPLTIPEIDGDLLNLVHLSNEFKLANGSKPLRVGDSIEVTSRIEAMIVSDKGKTITVRATITRQASPVVFIISRFLIKGSSSKVSGTFRREEEPEMIFEEISPIDEAVLRSRKWFCLDDNGPSLTHKTLLFRLDTFCTWKTRTVLDTLRTTGVVFSQESSGRLTRVGYVSMEARNCQGNPVMDFLTRKARPNITVNPLEHPGWNGTSTMTFKMPSSSQLYSRVSKDCNPIHVSPTFANLANLPGPIVHGMYTSAVAETVLDYLVDDLAHLRLRRYSISFVAMVFPGDQLNIKIRHVAMVQGRMIIAVQAFKADDDDKVLEGEAELEQLSTTYLFTGQGSQQPGMGLNLYNSSPVAKKIWDDMDKYFLENYGWSMLQVTRENPKELTIHFAGKRGRKIRDRYMAMSLESIGSNGQRIVKPVLDNLTANTRSYTFRESRGLLYATQFAQPCITTLEKATFEDMKAKGLIQEDAPFAGHSLGEYGVLAALTEFMPFELVMDVVFYRGLTMQMAIDRDEKGSTGYSMVAVNPGRVSKSFDEAAVRLVTGMIASESKELLEIVNLNVDGEQYVCAGHVRNIYALTQLLNELSNVSSDEIALWIQEAVEYTSSTSRHYVETAQLPPLVRMVSRAVQYGLTLPKPIHLERGRATIPLLGIDVPFHSSQLRPEVAKYRKFLSSRVRIENQHVDVLEGRFVPNVMGKPFSLDREYIEEAMRLTGSPVLREMLETVY